MSICLNTVNKEEFKDYLEETIKYYAYPLKEHEFMRRQKVIRLAEEVKKADNWDLSSKKKIIDIILG